VVRVAGSELARQSPLDPSRDDGKGAQCLNGAVGEQRASTEHDITNRLRDGIEGCGDQFGHEERVAAGHPVDVAGVVRTLGPHRRDGRQRQRLQRDTDDLGTAQRPEQTPERVADIGRLDSVGQHQDHGQPADATRQTPHDVQRRVIGPVQVLDDDNDGMSRFDGNPL
jgi:hypothetical protein